MEIKMVARVNIGSKFFNMIRNSVERYLMKVYCCLALLAFISYAISFSDIGISLYFSGFLIPDILIISLSLRYWEGSWSLIVVCLTCLASHSDLLILLSLTKTWEVYGLIYLPLTLSDNIFGLTLPSVS